MKTPPKHDPTPEAALDEARRILKAPSPTLAELRAIDQSVIEAQTVADAQRTSYAEERPSVLLNGTDAELAMLDNLDAGAARFMARAEFMHGKLTESIARLQAEADESARKEAYRKAAASISPTMSEAESDYQNCLKSFRASVRKIATLRSAIYAVNRNLPAGAALLPDPNTFRKARHRVEATTKEERVTLWCFEKTANRVPAELLGRIHQDRDGRGWLAATPNSRDSAQRLEQREFRHIISTVPPSYIPDDLAVSVTLPGFYHDDPPGWTPMAPEPVVGDAVLLALDALDALEQGWAPRNPRQPLVKETFVPIDVPEPREGGASKAA